MYKISETKTSDTAIFINYSGHGPKQVYKIIDTRDTDMYKLLATPGHRPMFITSAIWVIPWFANQRSSKTGFFLPIRYTLLMSVEVRFRYQAIVNFYESPVKLKSLKKDMTLTWYVSEVVEYFPLSRRGSRLYSVPDKRTSIAIF